eukprot:6196363-Pleurochrysis_carterae.AAC.2
MSHCAPGMLGAPSVALARAITSCVVRGRSGTDGEDGERQRARKVSSTTDCKDRCSAVQPRFATRHGWGVDEDRRACRRSVSRRPRRLTARTTDRRSEDASGWCAAAALRLPASACMCT